MPGPPILDRPAKADWLIPITVNSLPAGVTVINATFILKQSKVTPDSGAIITKTITVSAGPQGQIAQVGTSATMSFIVPNEETDLTPGSYLYYRVYMTTVDS